MLGSVIPRLISTTAFPVRAPTLNTTAMMPMAQEGTAHVKGNLISMLDFIHPNYVLVRDPAMATSSSVMTGYYFSLAKLLS